MDYSDVCCLEESSIYLFSHIIILLVEGLLLALFCTSYCFFGTVLIIRTIIILGNDCKLIKVLHFLKEIIKKSRTLKQLWLRSQEETGVEMGIIAERIKNFLNPKFTKTNEIDIIQLKNVI